LSLIRQLGSGRGSSKKVKQDAAGDGSKDGNVLNVRKAVRFASGGEGAIALARKSVPRDGRQKRKGKR
jgi:regulator of ribosome biosynthesis